MRSSVPRLCASFPSPPVLTDLLISSVRGVVDAAKTLLANLMVGQEPDLKTIPSSGFLREVFNRVPFYARFEEAGGAGGRAVHFGSKAIMMMMDKLSYDISHVSVVSTHSPSSDP